METVVRFIGKITWIDGDILIHNPGFQPFSTQIIRGIKGEGYFNFDYAKNKDDNGGLVKLKTSDGFEYVGGLFYDNDKTSSAIINLKFFENKKNALLFGSWIQETYHFTTIVELNKVEKF